MKNLLFFSWIILLSGCSNKGERLPKKNLEIIFVPTYNNEKVFVLLERADSMLGRKVQVPMIDSVEASRRMNDTTLPLIERMSPTPEPEHEMTMDDYRVKNPLFYVCTPNITMDDNKITTLTKSCFIGISKGSDSLIVNEFLSRNSIKKLFPRDVIFKWINSPGFNGFSKLVAIKKNGGERKLEISNLDSIGINKGYSEPILLNLMSKLSQRLEYDAYIFVKQKEIDGIFKSSNDDDVFLVQVIMDDSTYFASTSKSEIRNGIQLINEFTEKEAKRIEENYGSLIKMKE